MDPSDVITALVAVYGAVLSTCTAVVSGYLAYCRWREKTPNIQVRISTGLDHGIDYIFIEASNPGERAVVLCSKGFLLPGHKKRIMTSYGDYGSDFVEPYELLLEHSCEWRMTASRLAEI